ncbi:hypothetical protein [Dictyobacter formicarum]|uniref:hypothetical protein n=1 Tax=Dictyobacter formicarum TaxID=2778368 RepID=UPI001916C56E|nr:hypothetical protein [Dictyobacter formicarum]
MLLLNAGDGFVQILLQLVEIVRAIGDLHQGLRQLFLGGPVEREAQGERPRAVSWSGQRRRSRPFESKDTHVREQIIASLVAGIMGDDATPTGATERTTC